MKLLLILLLLNFKVFAKTVKFHAPQTEAEKALDLILRIESGLEKNTKMKQEDIFTKEFSADYKRQKDEALNSEGCRNFQNNNSCFIYQVNDIFGKYNKVPSYQASKSSMQQDESAVSTNCTNKRGKCIIADKNAEYYMKKENGKWKIDGINAGEYDGEFAININYNDKDYYTN